MTHQTRALFIAITWAGLLAVYFIGRRWLAERLNPRAAAVMLTRPPGPLKPPGTLLTRTGVLFVFAANIVTLFLFFFDALSPAGRVPAGFRVNLPGWAVYTGMALFLLVNAWATLAMLFNPGYTPLYKLPPQQFLLANRGPYAIVRHPRYTAEALLNIILFLLTGIWLPLLGLIGWAAVVCQARAEERFLMMLAPQEYARYRNQTGMFFPKAAAGRRADR